MKTFEEFVLSWWNEYIENATEETARDIMVNEFLAEEEDLSDELAYDDSIAHTCKDWLALQDDAYTIYKKFFGYDVKNFYDNMPDTPTFLADMFLQAAGWCNEDGDAMPDFVREFCFEMAGKAADYTEPSTYFKDLSYGGCLSGFVSMLIYNSDCKRIYIEHIDEMENYIEQIEEECGEALKNRNGLPHYTFVCWACFEQLGYRIAQTLFPDTF